MSSSPVHRATLTIEDEDLRVEITCSGDHLAQCRQICAEPGCEDEFYAMELDKQDGDRFWTHVHYEWVLGEEQPTDIVHRMKDGGYCNAVEFIYEGGYPQEFYIGEKASLNNTPIQVRWNGDHYEWWPADQEEPPRS